MQIIPAGALPAIYGNRVEWFRYELHRWTNGLWGSIDDDLQGVRSCTIQQDRRARIKRSATFALRDDAGINFTSDRIRVFWNFREARTGSTTYEFKMGTFSLNTPTLPLLLDGRIRSVTGYDSLAWCDAEKLEDWLVIPVGDNVTITVINILSARFPGAGILLPLSAERIGDNESNPSGKIFEIGMPILDVLNKLLAYINYNSLRCNVDGSFMSEPYVLPAARTPEFAFSDEHPLFIGDASVLNFDVFDAPNRFVLSCGRPGEPAPYPLISQYDVPSGPFSAAQRNGTVFTRHESVDVISQAKLDELAKILAADALMDRHTLLVKTPLLPSDWADCVTIGPYARLPASEPQFAKYVERSWSFPCVPGGVMEHVYAPVFETT